MLTEEVYIPPFKRNNKENTYFARLDKGKSSDIDALIFLNLSLNLLLESIINLFLCLLVTFVVLLVILNQIVLCWGKKPKSENRFAARNTDVPKFVHVCHFCDIHGHIRPNCHKLKFKHSVFQSRICDDISPAISSYKLFHILLKTLNLLACETNLQDFSLSQKIGVIPQIHSASHGFSPTKSKTRVIWVRKDSLRRVLLTCPWFNSFNCLWTCLDFVFGCFVF